MALNQGQQDAADAIYQFLLSDEKEFSLSGPAGTGKTFLMQHVLSNVMPKYERTMALLGKQAVNFDVELTATTNKAVEALESATGQQASTLHSYLGLKVWDDYQTGETKIKETSSYGPKHNQLVFVDEASMIDRALHTYLLDCMKEDCKIIYLGDHCQMAPVNEDISPVYDKPKLGVNLQEPMRNAGQPALKDLCARLRKTVNEHEFFEFPHEPGVIDHVSGAQAEAEMVALFSKENLDARVLAFTNDRVQEYNDFTRTLRGYPELFTKGEHLVCNQVFQFHWAEDQSVGLCQTKVEQVVQVVGEPSAVYEHEFYDSNNDAYGLNCYDLPLLIHNNIAMVRVPVNYAHVRAALKHFKQKRDWPTFYTLKNSMPDLRMRDACTVYKAQGSTYETVFMDLGNIGTSYNHDQVARMLYVGASRATTRLVLFSELPGRYRGYANTKFQRLKETA